MPGLEFLWPQTHAGKLQGGQMLLRSWEPGAMIGAQINEEQEPPAPPAFFRPIEFFLSNLPLHVFFSTQLAFFIPLHCLLFFYTQLKGLLQGGNMV